MAAGEEASTEIVGDHLTEELITAAPDWSLEQAAEAMLEGGFRHLLVVNGAELEGILSMRDIVRCWAADRVHELEARSRRAASARAAARRTLAPLP